MKIPYYHVDAFSSRVFAGNPAGVCLLEQWLEDFILQAIAAENRLSETAFLVKKENHYALRWFTPKMEVDLCGHATLASAFVIFNYVDKPNEIVRFETKSGMLAVRRSGNLLSMDFPSRKASACMMPDHLIEGLQATPREVLRAPRDFLAVFESEQQIRSLQPDFEELKKLDCLGVIVTAPGLHSDFVSRFFAPNAGIPEDPVTGSAHCTLIPYWSERLGKPELHALQISERGGELFCTDDGDRVRIAGSAVIYLKGTLTLSENCETGEFAAL
jgi:PhzF family phenazine biosynthesis protein